MSMFEEIFLYPIRLLVKMFWLVLPLISILLLLPLVISYPFGILNYILGFLISPLILRKTGIYHTDVSNSLELFQMKTKDLKKLETMYSNNLDQITRKYRSKERKFKHKIEKLYQETKQLDDKYTNITDGKPDRVVYVQPRSFLQLLKNKVLGRG